VVCRYPLAMIRRYAWSIAIVVGIALLVILAMLSRFTTY
jgi:hypothetical protein